MVHWRSLRRREIYLRFALLGYVLINEMHRLALRHASQNTAL